MEHQHHTKTPATDHSKMDHSTMHHGSNPSMGMAGHDHSMMIADFKKRFFVVLALTLPIMLLSAMIQRFIGVDWQFAGSSYLLFALSTVVFFYGGWPFLTGWIGEIKAKNPGMMFLIGFAITVAYIYSVAIVFGLKGMDFFWELTTLIGIMLLGHWIEMKSIAGASKELELLVQLMPSDAHMVMADMIHDVKTDTLKENDIILVKPGEKVAADGIILEGESYLNESMLTGESKPVKKVKGDKVIAGSINGSGSFKVTVSHAAKDSYLSQVVKLVDDAQKSKSKNTIAGRYSRQVVNHYCFVQWYRHIFILVFDGPALSLRYGKNGYRNCDLLPSRFGFSCPFGSSQINGPVCKEWLTDQKQERI